MVDILMAVFNGENFLAQQLESLMSQDFDGFRLIACDDGSSDGSRDILEAFGARFPDRIKTVYNDKNVGVRENFFALMALSDAEYIMFCDQDDVWDSGKVQKTLDVMRQNEYGGPLLVHADMRVVDSGGAQLAPSFNKMQSIDPRKNTLNALLAQNTVTGCTVMINRALADIVKKPCCDTLHDWWLALTAAALGRIVYLPEQVMDYRRHGANVRGARDMSDAGYIMGRALDSSDARAKIRLGYAQSAELARLYADKLDERQQKMLLDFGACLNKNKLGRLAATAKYRIWKQGLVRKLGQLFYL
ncbi:MAG: glycosyltransferase family 2 protein [Firmicutes bacterium]|nr:glycosyltransferase family 2 protein [Bacillota bacterium]